MPKKGVQKGIELSRREGDALTAIRILIDQKGYSPTYDEIAKAIGSDRSGAAYLVRRLAAKGCISRVQGSYRSIRVVPVRVA